MIYLGKYYQDMGFSSSLIIPRYTELNASTYRIVIVNNIDKTTIVNDTELDDNIELNSKSPFYYKFDSIDLSGITDGEYTIQLYANDVLVYKGLMTYRRNAPKDVSVYNTSTAQYIVYNN